MIFKLCILFFTMLSFPAFAKVVNVENYEKKVIGNLKVGAAFSKSDTPTGQEDEVFLDTELTGRYAFNNYFGAFVGVGKLLGKSSSMGSNSGSLAYHLSGGLVLAVTGQLIDRTKTEVDVSYLKKEGDGKYNIISRYKKKTTKNDFNGFRVSVYASEYSFSGTQYVENGGGGSIFYEHRLGESNYMQYGAKADFIRSSSIEANLIQTFIGFGF